MMMLASMVETRSAHGPIYTHYVRIHMIEREAPVSLMYFRPFAKMPYRSVVPV